VSEIYRGFAHVYGDHIDTDRIIAGKYTKTLDRSELARHALEDLDADFSRRVRLGDVVIAGENFGCGSSREQAPLALQAAGIGIVVARSFARIFYRNAINIGLAVVQIEGVLAENGDEIEVDVAAGTYHNHRNNQSLRGAPLPEIMVQILRAGGLIPYLQAEGTFRDI
jgi:3-isopropylmalate dehydratase small subunit